MKVTDAVSDPAHSALILVDIQPDFMPGGALAVAEGDAILPGVNELIASDAFAVIVATQDWHPAGHISFASQHAGRQPFDEIELYGKPQTLWPDHCLQGSPGAALHPDLHLDRLDCIIRKGTQADVDSYSGFRNNWNASGERPATGLAGYLRERKIRDVYLCGLARDVCVKWTAEDATAAGFDTCLLWELSRPVNPETNSRVRTELVRTGVRVVGSAEART